MSMFYGLMPSQFASYERASQSENLAHLAFALAIYRAEHGQYPDRLDALVPKYAPEVPRDRFAGEPLRYRRTGADYILYSVGENGRDDGGRRAGDEWQPEAPNDADDIAARTGLPPMPKP